MHLHNPYRDHLVRLVVSLNKPGNHLTVMAEAHLRESTIYLQEQMGQMALTTGVSEEWGTSVERSPMPLHQTALGAAEAPTGGSE